MTKKKVPKKKQTLQQQNEQLLRDSLSLRPYFICQKPTMGNLLTLLEQVTTQYSEFRRFAAACELNGVLGTKERKKLNNLAERKAVALVKQLVKGYKEKSDYCGLAPAF